jgi:enoyl-[acyl-carrier-protein] reductase (NADH)
MFEFDGGTFTREEIEPIAATDKVTKRVDEETDLNEDYIEIPVDQTDSEQGTEWFHKLGLNQEEIDVLKSIDYSESEAVKGDYGTVKVKGDCLSTTCVYTETTYNCAYTKDS